MAFLTLLVYLFMIYIRPGEWIPALFRWQLFDLATAAAVFFMLAEMALGKRGFVKAPHNGLMAGFFVAIVLSHVAHTYLGGMISSIRFFLVNMIVYVLIVNIVTTPSRLRTTLWVLVGLSAVLAVQGILQHQTGHGWAGQPTVNGRITWIGIFNDPNDLALAFVMFIPVLLGAVFTPGFFLFKGWPVGLLGLLMYGVYLTNSRGGILALMVTLAFFFIQRSRRWRLLGGVVGLAAASLVFLFGPSRLGMLSAQESSAVGRLDAWYHGFQLFKRSPIFGAGMNMFTEEFPLTAHNSFVLALAELGIVGYVAWVGLLYVSFKALALVQRHDARLAPYALGLQAGLVGFAAAAFFLSRTYILLPYLLVALSAAMLNIARNANPACAFVITGKDRRDILFSCLGIMVLVQIAMKTWL
jgi:O-antigen ligase